MRHAPVLRRVGATIALILAVLFLAAGGPRPVAAQSDPSITTPFPAVSVQAGNAANFDLTVSAAEAARVDLSVDGLPDGWSASLSGGGNEIQSVFVTPDAPATVTLAIDVAEDASAGTTTVAVLGQAGDETARLEIELIIADAAGGSVTLESEIPTLRGPADQDYQFNLTLQNDTPQELTFGLQAEGPPGWEVTVQPSGETNAASVTVDARGSQRLEVTATAPVQAAASSYPLTVSAAAGDQVATADLVVEVTGSVQMELTTPDERLNTTANADATRDFAVVVVNTGTSPLTGVDLAGSGPSEWEITFEPATLEDVPPGQSVTATAHITPSGNAVAGDYAITLSAQSTDVNESLEIRVTVETAPIWGIVGAALILATLGGMAWIFRRYGRR